MIDERFVILGVLLNFAGSIGYAISTVKGVTKPNRVTWFIWALAPIIAFAAEIKQGVGLASLTTFMFGFGPLLIFLSSFVNKKAYWKLSKLDVICGILSLAGLLLWGLTRVGNIAIFFSIIADGLAAIPTITKSYTNPETENYQAYFFAAISAAIALATIKVWNFAHFGFPLYALLVCALLTILIKFEVGKILSQKA